MMNIADLSYLEHVSQNESILGGDAVSLVASVGFPSCLFAGFGVDLKGKFRMLKPKTLGTTGVSGVAGLASVTVEVVPGSKPVVSYEGFDKVEVTTAKSVDGEPPYEMVSVTARSSS